jgi:hypothetical protein
MTVLERETPCEAPMSDVDDMDGMAEELWQVWKSMDLPDGLRAEIVEESIEVSPTGRRRHLVITSRLRRALDAHLQGSGFATFQDGNVVHGRKVCIPDLFIGPEDPEDIPDEEGLGVDATRVPLVVEVVSPGRDAHQRDHERKRRFYATAGVPIYVIIDDYDNEGTVTVLTEPDPGKGIYAAVTHAPYGKRVVIQDGPAKLFTFDEKITAA